jgi:hypothetical protein
MTKLEFLRGVFALFFSTTSHKKHCDHLDHLRLPIIDAELGQTLRWAWTVKRSSGHDMARIVRAIKLMGPLRSSPLARRSRRAIEDASRWIRPRRCAVARKVLPSVAKAYVTVTRALHRVSLALVAP